MMGLKGCGAERMYRDNARVIADLWEMVDEKGKEVEWREIVKERGMIVAFL